MQTAPIPALAKVKQTGDQSHPSTPALETPVPETPNQGTKPKAKRAKKVKKEETPVNPAGSKTSKIEEKQEPNGTAIEGASKQSEVDGKNDKVDGLATKEQDKKGDEDVGSRETQKEAGSSSAAAAAVEEPIKANGSSIMDSVSTDSTTVDTTGSDGKMGAMHPPGYNNHFDSGSPTKPWADVLNNGDFLKSPQEMNKSPGFLGSILKVSPF